MTTLTKTGTSTIDLARPKQKRAAGRAAAAKDKTAAARSSRRASARSRARGRKRPVAAEDLLKFQILSDPQVSPDGSQVLFSHKRAGAKNKYETNLWIVSSDGKEEPRPFSRGNKDAHGRWSPDGSRIAFISGREEKQSQIFIIDAGGGEARRLTDFPEGTIATFQWSPDGKSLAVKFREQEAEWTEKAKKERDEKGLSTPARVIDDWWYRLDGDGYFGAARYRLYLVDAATGSHRKIYDKDALGFFEFDFSPDGRQIALLTNRDRQALVRPWKDELLRLDVRSGKVSKVPNVPEGSKTCVKWSPDGKSIAWGGREDRDPTYGTDNLDLYVCDAVRGGARNLTKSEDYCLMAVALSDSSEVNFGANIQWSHDSKRIYAQIGWHGETHIASVAANGSDKRMTFHTAGCCAHQMGNLSADGKSMALTFGNPTQVDEVHIATVSSGRFRTRPLTNINKPLLDELDVAQPEEYWVKAEDGHAVHVWVLKPQGYKKGRAHPAILEIHGGPHAQYGVGFFHEFQVLAANGYMVFYANPRGSKGYGRDHCAAIRGAWGDKDWIDVQAVTKFMQSRKDVDSKRMGVMGGSYGGYMTNWVIGHTHAFAAAITDRCVSNLVSMFGTSDFYDEPDRYWPGNSWDRPEKLWEMSPLKYLGNAKTPTLIIHSEGDLRCNVEQAEQVFAVLKHRNVPTRFVRYPRETSHGFSRGGPPDLRLHRLDQIVDWWAKWLSPKKKSRAKS